MSDAAGRPDGLVTDIMSAMVYADDFAAALAFYRDVLGLHQGGQMSEEACFLELGGRRYGLYLEGGHARRPVEDADARASFTLDVRSASALHGRLREAGATLLHDAPSDMGNGTFWFQFRDPAGNIIEAIGPR